MTSSKVSFRERISRDKIRWLKIIIWFGALSHLAYLVGGLFSWSLGPNPVEVITHQTGEWALRFLVASLMISPLRKLFHWSSLIRLRRLLGLWSFTYVLLHFLTLIVFDHFFSWQSILADIVERPYITVGFAAFVLMLPLAITSLKFFIKKLGKNWVRLHQLVYGVAVLAVIHYWWLVKADILEPLIYGLVLALLLGVRCYWFLQKKALPYGKQSA